jgi:Holliday junction resolvase-like predicted endonuclease
MSDFLNRKSQQHRERAIFGKSSERSHHWKKAQDYYKGHLAEDWVCRILEPLCDEGWEKKCHQKLDKVGDIDIIIRSPTKNKTFIIDVKSNRGKIFYYEHDPISRSRKCRLSFKDIEKKENFDFGVILNRNKYNLNQEIYDIKAQVVTYRVHRPKHLGIEPLLIFTEAELDGHIPEKIDDVWIKKVKQGSEEIFLDFLRGRAKSNRKNESDDYEYLPFFLQ